jgi:hypothetical protein
VPYIIINFAKPGTTHESRPSLKPRLLCII